MSRGKVQMSADNRKFDIKSKIQLQLSFEMFMVYHYTKSVMIIIILGNLT